MVGRATSFHLQDLLKHAPRLLGLPRAARREQINLKLWICQRCYYHNQRGLDSDLGIHIVRETNGRRSRTPRIAFSKTHSRALSAGTNNAGDEPRSDLPSQEEGRRSHISKRFSHLMDHLQSNIFIAGQRLNDLTGYSGIEALKRDIEQQGRSLILVHFRR